MSNVAQGTREVCQYDYQGWDTSIAEMAQDAVGFIKSKFVKAASDIWEVGQKLATIKDALEHGQWALWLEAEFSMSDATARRYMAVYRAWPQGVGDWQGSQTALYRLSSPEVSEEARQQALALSDDGVAVTTEKVSEIIGGPADRSNEASKTHSSPIGGKINETPLGELAEDMESPVGDEDPGWDRDKAFNKIKRAYERFREDCDFNDYAWLADMIQPWVDDLRLE